jgi:hypothetical protein
VTAPVSVICNLSILTAFEDLTTGLATALRYSFANEAGDLSPRLCIVRDLTLCSTVRSLYEVNSTVNTAEVDAQGGWTGAFTRPLESSEAMRVIRQEVVQARLLAGGPAKARRLKGVSKFNAVDAGALQTLLSAAATGVFVINVGLTTASSNVGVVIACLLSSSCADGNSTGITPANISSSSSGEVTALATAGGFQAGALDAVQSTAMSWAVSRVLSALANATKIAPSEFSGFVNVSAATVSFESASAQTSPSASPPRDASGGTPAYVAAVATIGALGGLGLLGWILRQFCRTLLKKLSQRPADSADPKADDVHHQQRSEPPAGDDLPDLALRVPTI